MYKKRHLARHTFVDDLILFRCHCNDHATDFGNEARLFVMLEHFSAFKRARAVSVGLLLVARRAEATRSLTKEPSCDALVDKCISAQRLDSAPPIRIV